jgi:hypothetical protein
MGISYLSNDHKLATDTHGLTRMKAENSCEPVFIRGSFRRVGSLSRGRVTAPVGGRSREAELENRDSVDQMAPVGGAVEGWNWKIEVLLTKADSSFWHTGPGEK